MSSRRSEQLKSVAKEFCQTHDVWVESKNRPAPDQAYWDAVDMLREAYQAGDVPSDCRGLADAVALFAEAVDEYDERDNATQVYADEAFWQAREGVAAALRAIEKEERPLPALESMASLRALNPPCSDEQIAKIYGLRDRHGNWLVHLVQKEIDVPGSVLKTPGAVDGRDWVHPQLAERQRQEEAAERSAEKSLKRIEEKRAKAPKPATPCPETARELWELGLAPGATPVTVKQAAKMLCQSEADVAQQFAAFEAEREAAIESGEIITAQAQQIRELAQGGMKPAGIAQRLEIEPKKVAAALKGWKKKEPEPETTGA